MVSNIECSHLVYTGFFLIKGSFLYSDIFLNICSYIYIQFNPTSTVLMSVVYNIAPTNVCRKDYLFWEFNKNRQNPWIHNLLELKFYLLVCIDSKKENEY